MPHKKCRPSNVDCAESASSPTCSLLELPNELLLRIITFARTTPGPVTEVSDVGNTDILRMASVCRKFRDVIFANAGFWTNISDTDDPMSVCTALQRSRGAPISLWLTWSKERAGESLLMLELIGEDIERLERLEICSSNEEQSYEGEWQAIRELLEFLSRANLPALTKLVFYRPRNGEDVINVSDHSSDTPLGPDDELLHFYTRWQAPKLKDLEIHELVPRMRPGLQLRSLDILFMQSWPRTEENLFARLLQFLEAQPSLDNISIVFAVESVHPDLEFFWDKRIHLPNAQFIFLMYSQRDHLETSTIYIQTLVRSLDLPAVKVARLHLMSLDPTFTLDAFFPPGRKYIHLEELALSGRPESEYSPLALFKTIFSSCPSLKSLATYDVPIDESTLSLEEYPQPPIEFMGFYVCPELTASVLSSVLQYLCRGPHWSKFEKLEIRRCPRISKADCRELAEILPDDKLKLTE